jgi:hypothetical protein
MNDSAYSQDATRRELNHPDEELYPVDVKYTIPSLLWRQRMGKL